MAPPNYWLSPARSSQSHSTRDSNAKSARDAPLQRQPPTLRASESTRPASSTPVRTNQCFAFRQLLNIIQLLFSDSLTTCLNHVDWGRCSSFLTAKERILGYSVEPDFRPAQAASAFRYCSARYFSFRTLLH